MDKNDEGQTGNTDIKFTFRVIRKTSLALKYSFATAKEHDSTHFKDLIDSVSRSEYILLDSACDSEEIYNMILEKTSAIPVIDINPRRGSRKPSPKDKSQPLDNEEFSYQVRVCLQRPLGDRKGEFYTKSFSNPKYNLNLTESKLPCS